MELLIIGIDAMDSRIFLENINSFPNMKKIADNGVFADYRAYAYGYGSDQNWISIYTGLTPKQSKEQNIFKKNKIYPDIEDFKNKNTFWNMFNKKGYTVGMWKAFMTSPGEKINGYMVTGEHNYDFGAENRPYLNFNPVFFKEDENLSNYISGHLEGPVPCKTPQDYGYTWEQIFKDNAILDKILNNPYYYKESIEFLEKEINFYCDNIIKIQTVNPVDILFYYNATLDLIQHFHLYDRNKTAIIESMKIIDDAVGRMIKELDPKRTVLLSDHGASSFNEVLYGVSEKVQREAFGWANNSAWTSDGSIITRSRIDGFLSGNHDVYGTFLAAGEGIKKCTFNEMRTVDIYPTLLEMFDIDIPDGRDGYVMDIFEDKKIANDDRLLIEKDIKKKNIAIIQNIDVPKFNNVVNEVFIDNRFSEITVFCEEKYAPIFSVNPRIKNVLIMKDRTLNFDDLNKFEEVYISYRNMMTDEVDYIKINN